jgi:hypothetical protein
MYAKLINGVFTTAPKKLFGNGTIIYNPPTEMYLEQGWKPVIFTDPPEAPEGYYYESSWEEQTNNIV